MFGFDFLDTLNQKSKEILDIYKKDLTEFAQSVAEETKPVASLLLPTLPDFDENEEGEGNNGKGRGSQITVEEKIEILRASPQTFLQEIFPEEEETMQQLVEKGKSSFEEWCKGFDINSKTDEITELLKQSEKLKHLHGELVPVQVKYDLFWQRYFYRHELLLKEDERRKKIEELSKVNETEENLTWDDDDDDDDDNDKMQNNDKQKSKKHSITDLQSKIDSLSKQVKILSQLKEISQVPVEKEVLPSTLEGKSTLLGELIEMYEERLKKQEEQIQQLKTLSEAQSNHYDTLSNTIHSLLNKSEVYALIGDELKSSCPFLFQHKNPSIPDHVDLSIQHTEDGLSKLQEEEESLTAIKEKTDDQLPSGDEPSKQDKITDDKMSASSQKENWEEWE